MTDREKTIKDIEECLSASCRGFRPRKSCPYNDEEWDIMRDALAMLKEQQSKTGKWIPVTNGRGGHECNQCHDYAPSYQDGDENLSRFCPCCGAKMENGTD